MIEGDKIINFFNAMYDIDEEITDMRKDMSQQMKSYAENIEIQPSALKSAYSLYKRYKSGKNTQSDCEEYSELSGIIENYFACSEDIN